MQTGMMKKTEVLEQKAKLRRHMKAARSALAASEKTRLDAALCKNLLQLVELLEADSVYCYVSFGKEADTIGLLQELWRRGVKTAVPRVEGKRMEFYRIGSMDDLMPGYMGIPEPKTFCPRARDARAPVITPGLAFTIHGERLGYGGGYYDRFFEKEPEHMRIGAAYPFQMADRIPVEETDRRLSMVVTGEGIYRCR